MAVTPLYKQIANLLRDKIAAGEFANSDRLPSEPHLAKELGVARTTLREALYLLEEEGLILRKKGVGSFIKPNSSQILEGIEKLQSYIQLIHQNGYKATEKVLSAREIKIQSFAAGKLKVSENSLGHMVESVYLADNAPAIYCCDIIPGWLVKNRTNLENIKLEGSLFDHFQECCGVSIHYTVQQVHIVLAYSPVSDILEVPQGTPLLQMKGFGYDEEDKPLYMSNAYFRSDLFEFIIIRRK